MAEKKDNRTKKKKNTIVKRRLKVEPVTVSPIALRRGKKQNAIQSTLELGDKNILERSWSLWRQGDWESLTKLDREDLEHHPNGDILTLLTAAGFLQFGDMVTAKKYVCLAQDLGCNEKLISQIMIASVHYSLGKASTLAGQNERATRHFNLSIIKSTLSGEDRSLDQYYFNQQPGPFYDLKVTVGCKHDLGVAWAGNIINTVIFRHHGILTHDGHQFTAFYVDERTLRLVQRHLSTNVLHTHDILGEYNLHDAHNSISLGVDSVGYLHLCYDHHATQLRYRRALQPNNIVSWTDEIPMTGQAEDQMTYPTFILPRQGYPLTLLYRDGTHNNGAARLKTYDEVTKTWADHPKPILSGTEQKPWTSNAYWNHPAIGRDGALHLSFVWRTDTLGDQKLVNNVNIGYAWSPDNGCNWFTAKGQPYKLPITPAISETIWPISAGSNLINQCSMALDSNDLPHISFYANDEKGIPQYQHLWFNGRKWECQVITSRKVPFTLSGGGTLQLPISRPEIIIDRSDSIFVVYRGDLTNDIMVAARIASGISSEHLPQQVSLWPEPLGYAEPLLDRTRWQSDQILTMLLQYNKQTDGDRSHEDISSNVFLVDFILS